jgi:hypothetical protein
MMRRQARGYTLWTSRGTGSYRTWSRALSAARWAAERTGSGVSLVSDETGAMWDVSADGRASWRSV